MAAVSSPIRRAGWSRFKKISPESKLGSEPIRKGFYAPVYYTLKGVIRLMMPLRLLPKFTLTEAV